MHGAFCDQPWPGNDAGDDPGQSRTVGSGDTRRTWLIPCGKPEVLLCRSFVCNSRFSFLGILPRRKKFSKTRNKMLQFVKFQSKREKNAAISEISVKTRKKELLTTLTPFGDANISNTLSRGQFENPTHTPRGKTACPSAVIPGTQPQIEGSGRRFNRTGPRASSKK